MTHWIKRNTVRMLILFSLCSGNTLFAQIPDDVPQGVPPISIEKQITKMLAHLNQELSLNDEQNEQISELFVSHFETLKKLPSTTINDYHSMEAIKTEFENQVLNQLSNEQKTQFNTFIKKRAPKSNPNI